MTETRTQWTIEVEQGGKPVRLIPIGEGNLDITRARLKDLREDGLTARLVKREVTMTEWEAADA